MADIVQTYVLKVNIGCCNACPRTLKKMLLNNKGVEKFDVDQGKNVVSVTGKVNLHQLIKDIKKKIKKNAELIKKESGDSEKKQQSEKENSYFGNKEESQRSQEHMAPPQQFSENIYSRYEIPTAPPQQFSENIYSRYEIPAPPQQFSENIYSRYEIPAGIHDQNIYHPFMQMPLRDPRYHGRPPPPPWVFYPPLC